MGDLRKFNGGGGSSEHKRNKQILVPKPETLDYDLPCDTACPQQIGGNVASSSGSNVRSLLIEMGFRPSLIQKAIEEKGEDDIDLLLEVLTEGSVSKHSGNSSNGLVQPKQEPDIPYDVDDRRIALLTMNFPENLVDFALDKLGKDAPIYEMVDFIVAAQIAEECEEESEDSLDGAENFKEESDVVPVVSAARRVEVTNELLFETMDKTLHLLEMGFSDHEISLAIEKLGSKGQISELAETIVTGEVPGEIPGDCEQKEKKASVAPLTNHACPSKNWRFIGARTEDGSRLSPRGSVNIKPEGPGVDSFPLPTSGSLEESLRGKRLKDEDGNAFLEADSEYADRGKRLRPEYKGGSCSFDGPSWMEENFESKQSTYSIPKAMQPRLSQTLDPGVAKRPYFFYGNLANTSSKWWSKISNFLYGIHPEVVNSRSCSALSRKEGYVHNLPTENRFRVLSKPPTTIQDALPQTKRWWPSWDTRTHLNGISSKMSGISQLCDRLGNLLVESRGLPAPQLQNFILHHCQTSNLIWIAPNILSPMEPEHLELILGYPTNHTQIGGVRLAERLRLFECCFQTDTLGYHLSSLKHMFPAGLTVLSIFSGIGGAEVALAGLGIYLKGVVSVESSELSRSVLKKWWQTSGQNGELVQIEGIRSLTTRKLEVLMERFGGFDLIICQNPPTASDLSKERSETNPDGTGEPVEFDFTLFNEFVRVLQRVRDMMGTS